MKYLFRTLLIIIALFFSLKLIFYLLDNEHDIKYNLGNFEVKEHFKLEDGKHIYFFDIKNEKFNMTFEINHDFKKASKVLDDLKYYEKEKCVLPVFKKGEIIYDVMCKEKDTVYFNYDLNKKLKVTGVKKYKDSHFIDSAEGEKYEVNDIYKANIPEDHYLFVENYKGIVLINNEISTIKLFNNDVYKKEISTVVDKYYLVANYNEDLTFKSFYLINLINGKQREIRSVNAISFDSYIQGVVGQKVYLFDRDNQIQYEINLENELVTKVAEGKELKYYNGKWTTMTLKDAMDKKLFNSHYSSKFNQYIKTDKLDNYYVYEKENNYYNVYLINENNEKQRTFLFRTSNLDSVTYLDDYIYYQLDSGYYYYSNKGIRKVIKNSEIAFNDTIKFGVYEK